MSLHRFTFENPEPGAPLIILNQCAHIQISGNLPVGINNTLLQVEGSANRRITLYNNDLSVYRQPVLFKRGARNDAVKCLDSF